MADQAAPVVADANAAAAPAAEDAPQLMYRIVSKDNVEFKVSAEAIKQADTLNNLIGTMEYTDEDMETRDPIPVDNIDGKTLELVFKWCEHHKGEPIPVDDESVPKNVVIPEFDEQLMQIDNEALFDLICAANYLNIKQLLNVSCKKVANMAKGKSPEELRVIYGIPTDEEDEAAEKAAAEQAAKDQAAKEKAAKEAAAKNDAGEGPSTA